MTNLGVRGVQECRIKHTIAALLHYSNTPLLHHFLTVFTIRSLTYVDC